MKHSIGIALVVMLILQPQMARCGLEGDRNIPISKYTAAQAIEKVSKYYQDSKADPERFIISVVYGRPDRLRPWLGNNFVPGDNEEWSWFVTYTHPQKRESTIMYRLRENGEIYSLIQTRT